MISFRQLLMAISIPRVLLLPASLSTITDGGMVEVRLKFSLSCYALKFPADPILFPILHHLFHRFN